MGERLMQVKPEEEFEAVKTAAFRRYEKGKLHKDNLEYFLQEAFILGCKKGRENDETRHYTRKV